MRILRGVFGGSALRIAVTTAIAAGLSLVPAEAATIYGQVDFSGSVSVSLTTINFLPLASGSGFITLNEPSTGYFAGLSDTPPDTSATIVDLGPGNPPPVTPFIHSFTGTGLPLTLAGLVFNLHGITAPVGPLCTAGDPGVGNSCQFGVFNLLNAGTNSTSITLLITGEWINGADSGFATGRFTTQVTNSIDNIVSIISGGGAITQGYSATIEAVPEPGTMGLLGLAFVAIGMTRKFRS